MQKLDNIEYQCKKLFSLSFILIITICSTLVVGSLIFLCILWKCEKEYYHCITKFIKKKKPTKECETIEMVPIASGTQCNINARILKVLEKVLTPEHTKIQEEIHTPPTCYNLIDPQCLPPYGRRYPSLNTHHNT